jgi:uronate dehydrogenase
VIDATMPPRPDGHYGLSKAFGEDLSRFYFDRYGIETACVRIGSSFPEPKDRRMLATWLSYDDLSAWSPPASPRRSLGHSIVYGMSDNAVTWWDNTPARHIGYVPKDSSDVPRSGLRPHALRPTSRTLAQYQGGGFVAGPFGD